MKVNDTSKNKNPATKIHVAGISKEAILTSFKALFY